MKHYEIVLLIHPDQSDQVPALVKRYETMIAEGKGTVDRFEDWGRKQLAYLIQKNHKAHYLLFNITCGKETLEALKSAFRYNDMVLRDLIINVPHPITTASPLAVKPSSTPVTAASAVEPSSVDKKTETE